jgi:hypothetical protein
MVTRYKLLRLTVTVKLIRKTLTKSRESSATDQILFWFMCDSSVWQAKRYPTGMGSVHLGSTRLKARIYERRVLGHQ